MFNDSIGTSITIMLFFRVKIGGNLGLFLGLSLISVLDIFNLSRVKLAHCCKSRLRSESSNEMT
jgi:hypothetical protein